MGETAQSLPSRHKYLDTPVFRLVIETILFVFVLAVAQGLVNILPGKGTLIGDFLAVTLVVVLTMSAYIIMVRGFERRSVKELSTNGASFELGKGILIGAVLFALVILLLAVLGAFEIVRINPWSASLLALPGAISSGVVEELLFRGVLYRLTEDWLGSWPAIFAISILFGLFSLTGYNATLWSAIATGLQAGILLSAAFLLTRRLWMAMGIHFAWDFVQSGIFGVGLSGDQAKSLFTSALHGRPLLSGAPYGVEASIVSVTVCLLAAVVILRRAIRKGNLISSHNR